MPISFGDTPPTIPDGFEPEDFLDIRSVQRLRVSHTPGDRRTMESWTVYFEDTFCKEGNLENMFIEVNADVWLDYAIAPVVLDWLEANATDYIVGAIDRGDWGEGSPIGDVNFAVEGECRAFVERFDTTIHLLPYSRRGQKKRGGHG